jgi:hypothetical protein
MPQLVNTKIVKAEAKTSMVTSTRLKGTIFYLVMGDFAEDMIQGRTTILGSGLGNSTVSYCCAMPIRAGNGDKKIHKRNTEGTMSKS